MTEDKYKALRDASASGDFSLVMDGAAQVASLLSDLDAANARIAAYESRIDNRRSVSWTDDAIGELLMTSADALTDSQAYAFTVQTHAAIAIRDFFRGLRVISLEMRAESAERTVTRMQHMHRTKPEEALDRATIRRVAEDDGFVHSGDVLRLLADAEKAEQERDAAVAQALQDGQRRALSYALDMLWKRPVRRSAVGGLLFEIGTAPEVIRSALADISNGKPDPLGYGAYEAAVARAEKAERERDLYMRGMDQAAARFAQAERERDAARAEVATLTDRLTTVERAHAWQPIETAPRDNKRPLYIAKIDADGKIEAIDIDAVWMHEYESWELSHIESWFWASASGLVEDPTHWAYQDGPPPHEVATLRAAVERLRNPPAMELEETLEVPDWVAESIVRARGTSSRAPDARPGQYFDSVVVWLADDREKMLATVSRFISSERIMAARYHAEHAEVARLRAAMPTDGEMHMAWAVRDSALPSASRDAMKVMLTRLDAARKDGVR